ncbi:hypothetical protein SAMN05216359_103213 [Roseateles sp. YR242]|uniref:hypothetical protein n=1 Tax=Roseateles sp. YR242 TaxID=1855305 RepID=UPI0008CDDC9A|nr:hypothetical protein [Roseateles sp. YR242]SEK82085.1 hypothetical protein SAMN05216359_103213 [Roseateles sp. YR242]
MTPGPRPLLVDSLFVYMRLMAAGSAAQLALQPGGVLGVNSLDDALAQRANAAVARFVAEFLR